MDSLIDEMQELKDHLLLSPMQCRILFLKGYILEECKSYKEALEVFRTVVTHNEDYAYGYYESGECSFSLMEEAKNNHREKEADEYRKQSITFYEKANELEEGIEHVYFSLGILYGEIYQQDSSLQAYQKALDWSQKDFETREDSVQALINYAVLLDDGRKNQDAKVLYEKVAGSNAELSKELWANIYSNLGFTCYRMGEYEKAEQYLFRAIKYCTPAEMSLPYYNLIRLYYTTQQYMESLKWVKYVMERKDNNTACYVWAGRIYDRLGQCGKAVEFFEKAYAQGSNLHYEKLMTYERMSQTEYEKREVNLILTDLDAKKEFSKDVIILQMYCKRLDYKAADAKMRQMISRYDLRTEAPSAEECLVVAECCLALANFYDRTGKRGGGFFRKVDFHQFVDAYAKRAENMIINQKPDWMTQRVDVLPDRIQMMARLYLITGNYELAKQYANKALETIGCIGCRYRRCHKALCAMAMIAEQEKRYQDALSFYRQALAIKPSAFYRKKIEEVSKL